MTMKPTLYAFIVLGLAFCAGKSNAKEKQHLPLGRVIENPLECDLKDIQGGT